MKFIWCNFFSQGIKEVTLLGQNVNSYCDRSEEVHYGGLPKSEAQEGDKPENRVLSRGFKTIYKVHSGGQRFSHLLDQVSMVDPDMRIRFISPHPKDFPDEVHISLRFTNPHSLESSQIRRNCLHRNVAHTLYS